MLEEEYNPRRKLPAHLRPAEPPAPGFEYTIRDAELRDIPDMREIYNHYVLNSTVTFDEKPVTLAEMRKKFTVVENLGYPWLVAESTGGQVLGYAYVTPWKTKAAYRFTVENSIYLGPASTGNGIGRALMGRPKLLLLDEPTEGIQPNIVEEIEGVIGSLRGKMTILLVEQFLGFALANADHCYVLERGSVTLSGPPAELDVERLQAALAV